MTTFNLAPGCTVGHSTNLSNLQDSLFETPEHSKTVTASDRPVLNDFTDSHCQNQPLTSANTSSVTASDRNSPINPYTRAQGAKLQTPPTSVTAPTLRELKTLTGHPTPRGVHATKCPTCHTPTLVGLDNDVCAITAQTDPTPLDPQGELLALLQGRHTYRIDKQPGGNPKLTRRKAPQIRAPRKHWQQYDVIPEHKCGQQLPAIQSRIFQTATKTDPNQPAPF